MDFVFSAVVWQQMRAYTLALLSKLTPDGRKMEDKDIIDWVNETVSETCRNNIYRDISNKPRVGSGDLFFPTIFSGRGRGASNHNGQSAQR